MSPLISYHPQTILGFLLRKLCPRLPQIHTMKEHAGNGASPQNSQLGTYVLFKFLFSSQTFCTLFFQHEWKPLVSFCISLQFVLLAISEVKSLSRVRLFATPWTVACWAPLFRQEYWSGLPCPPLGDLLNPGMEPRSPTLQMDSLPAGLQGKPKNTGVGSLSPSPEELPNPGITLGSPAGGFFTS